MSLFLVIFLYLTAGATMPSGETPRGAIVPRCTAMEVWDFSTAMCQPLPMAGMPMQMAMIHANLFLVQSWASRPRGREALSVPGMIMASIGSSVGDDQYLSLELMATAEKWSVPVNGDPEFLQIGESRANGAAYLDAQHPHASPIMGVSLSDTITLEHDKDHLKFSFAPRGPSSDGPLAFMHRATGEVNPRAPLGHHVGQDVGHISSTVIGAALRLGRFEFEASTFNGLEPRPFASDLPMATPNSFALRADYFFDDDTFLMVSGARVKNPEPGESTEVTRWSASFYREHLRLGAWTVNQTFIWGQIANYDHAPSLNSFLVESTVQRDAHLIFARGELLQRTAEELEVNVNDPHRGRWVSALTLGASERVLAFDDGALHLGASLTRDFVGGALGAAYGNAPLEGNVFLRFCASRM